MLRLMRLSDKFQVKNCPAACARRYAAAGAVVCSLALGLCGYGAALFKRVQVEVWPPAGWLFAAVGKLPGFMCREYYIALLNGIAHFADWQP
jgi:hypothetical protein